MDDLVLVALAGWFVMVIVSISGFAFCEWFGV